jgi:hypothetical protein
MKAIPHRSPCLQTAKGEDGGIAVKIRFPSTKWHRWFGAPREYERQYVLDALGGEVLAACDGHASVQEIVDDFARDHDVSGSESEIAVTTYLRTLMGRGLIGMEIRELS